MPGLNRNGGKLQWILILSSIAILSGVIMYPYLTGGNEEEGSYANVTILGKDGTRMVMKYKDLKDMPSVTGKVKFENRLGNWGQVETFEGVLMSDLVEKAGGISPGDILRVTSTDGYYQDYDYHNIYPDSDWHDMQGNLILAYSSEGKEIPYWVEGPRTVFLPSDEEFSNEDAKRTSGLGQGYFLNPSAGGRMVRNSWKLEVMHFREPEDEWCLSLMGSLLKNLSRTEFEVMASDFRENVTDVQGRVWSGIPVWRLLGLVDGGPMRGENSYNLTYATSGYEVKFTGNQVYSLDSREAVGNASIIVADMLDGEVPDDGPVLVFPSMSVTGLVQAEFFPLWKVRVEGTESRELFLSEVMDLGEITGIAGYLKTTGAVRGPYEIVGVPLLSVIKEACEILGNYSIEVEAIDGYTMMLSQDEVEGRVDVYDDQGNKVGTGGVTSILYYEQDGSRDFSGMPLRMAYMGGGGQITDGHYWVKQVARLTVKKAVTDWSIELSGKLNYVLNRTTFVSAATCEAHRVGINITSKGETHRYEGLPLWVIISIIDGKVDTEGHYLFDDDLAREGYEVRISASDGFSTTLNSSMIWRNDGIILAHLMDGEVLPEGKWPLKLVGEGLSGKDRIGNIAKIELVLPPD